MESTSIQRSTLVTVVAWFLIVLGGFGALMGILQNVFIHLALPADAFQIPLEAEQTKQIPGFAKFMIMNINVIFAIFIVIPLLMFSSGIGLLKRKNWARLAIIIIMWLGVVWNLTGLVIQFIFSHKYQCQKMYPHNFNLRWNRWNRCSKSCLLLAQYSP